MRDIQAPCEQKREARIPQLLATQDKSVDELHAVINSLENRLQPVMMQKPGAEGKPECPKSVSGTVCDLLERHNEEIRLAIAKLTGILKDLEV